MNLHHNRINGKWVGKTDVQRLEMADVGREPQHAEASLRTQDQMTFGLDIEIAQFHSILALPFAGQVEPHRPYRTGFHHFGKIVQQGPWWSHGAEEWDQTVPNWG